MKLSKIVLVLVLALSIVSCKKKDDDGITPFLLTNANIADSHALTYYMSTLVETTNFNGLDIVSTTATVGDTFQLDYIFDENGGLIMDGAYRSSYTVDVNGTITMQDSEILVFDNLAGAYSIASSSSILVINNKSYEVTLFNETELRITREEITNSGGDTTVFNEEYRFTRN